MNLDLRLLRLTTLARLPLILTIGLSLGAAGAAVGQARLLSHVISQAMLAGVDLLGVLNGLGFLLILYFLRALMTWGSDIASSNVALKVKRSLRQQLVEKILALGPSYVQGERTGEMAHTAVEGIDALDAYFSQYLPQLVTAALAPVIFLFFVFPLDWISGLAMALTAPLIPLFMVLIGNASAALTRRQYQTLSRMSAYFLDVLQGLETLKMLGRSRSQAQVIGQASDKHRQATMNVLRVSFLSALTLELVSTLSTAIIAVEVGLRLLYGVLAFEEAFFVLLLAPEFYLPLRMLGARFHAGAAGYTSAQRIFEILETPGCDSAGCWQEAASTGLDEIEQIIFQDVAYTYPNGLAGQDEGGGRPTLSGVSFKMTKGQITALVGPSGSGKSTLASLLLRFLEPESGKILVKSGLSGEERPVGAYSPAAWRSKIAWVSQTPYLFSGTIAENIRLADPKASQEQVVAAARLANADQFIRALAQGYETPVGERGVMLSSGQAQRIAMARAFLKNAPILILDEAASSLDPEQETLIRQAVNRLAANRLTLVIAHRMNTVFQADQIFVLNEGRIVESGKHQSLMYRGGLYARLAKRATDYSLGEASRRNKTMDAAGKPERAVQNLDRVAHSNLGQESRSISPPKRASDWHILLRLSKLARGFIGQVALAVLLGFAAVASSMGLMSASAFIIAKASFQPSIADLQTAIVGVRFFGISRGVFRYLERYLSHQVTFRLLAALRVRFYQALEPLAPARLQRYRSGDLLSRIIADIESLESFYVRSLAPPLVALLAGMLGISFVGAFTIPVSGGPSIALLLILLLSGLFFPALLRRLSKRMGNDLVERRSSLNSALVEYIQGMAELLVYQQEGRKARQLKMLSDQATGAQEKVQRLAALQAALQPLMANLGLWAVLLLCIPMVHAGSIERVLLAVLPLAAFSVFESVQPLPQAAQSLENHIRAARRLFDIVDTEPEVLDPPQPLALRAPRYLEVRGLSFAYPARLSLDGVQDRINPDPVSQPVGQWALRDIRFSLSPGKRLAIVGPSGAGKSTLVHLLLRYWETPPGTIYVNGEDIHRYAADDLRKVFSVVPQRTYLFNASLRENLLLARPKATQAEIEWAVEKAQLTRFIASLPAGYETLLGEQGARLSGGQRQRIAIARALLKNGDVLLLDEPTANLDALVEVDLLRAIENSMHGRAVLMITHRLVAMESMDEILVLERGEILERGRHAELLAAGGMYRRMWELQSAFLASHDSG